MTIDPSESFRKARLRISCSLNIDQALAHMVAYFEQFISVEAPYQLAEYTAI